MFVQDFVKMPNGLPLGFPIQVDSANRCYRNVNQSLPSCRHFREEFFNKISPFCEDMKNHQPSFLGLFAFKLMFWEKEVNGNKSHLLALLKKETKSPPLVMPVRTREACRGKGTNATLRNIR